MTPGELDARNAEKARRRCAEIASAANMGRRVLSPRERRILAMWPRFDDGEPVLHGDRVEGLHGRVVSVDVFESAARLYSEHSHLDLRHARRVRRSDD